MANSSPTPFTRRRLSAYAVAAAYLAIASPAPPVLWIGLSVVAAGEALRLWATGHLVKNEALTRSGPYAHVRHPLYLGTLLIVVGFALSGSSLELPGALVPAALLPIALAVFFGHYLPRKTRAEAERLKLRHGRDADDWLRAVPALVPRVRPARLGPAGRFAPRRVLANSEHLTLAAVAAGAAFLVARSKGWIP